MKNVLKLASAAAIAATMSAPAFAESVPLNTVTGGQGQTEAAGQAEAGLLLGGTTAAVTTGLVVAVAVATVAASSDSATTTATP